jgi:hypothetical protein
MQLIVTIKTSTRGLSVLAADAGDKDQNQPKKENWACKEGSFLSVL